ncbi:MAG: GTP cyclohydrolase I FolE [Muribaculaceae bacterium]|nr:GTP cyclohydrolase I FolE [Muribaculaceae bacterium]
MNRSNDRLLEDERETLIEQVAEHYEAILQLIGEDTKREGLLKTPYRAAKALVEVTGGYNQSGEDVLNSAIFEYAGSNIVVVKDIEFYSLCEHHILPFFGKITIGYIPDGSIVGLSKLARIVDVYAKRLQVQERLTHEICQLLSDKLSKKGVIVICEAGHLCMKMRGVEKQESTTLTMEYKGAFENSEMRNNFMNMIK